jgi:hypothetical protein
MLQLFILHAQLHQTDKTKNRSIRKNSKTTLTNSKVTTMTAALAFDHPLNKGVIRL